MNIIFVTQNIFTNKPDGVARSSKLIYDVISKKSFLISSSYNLFDIKNLLFFHF